MVALMFGGAAESAAAGGDAVATLSEYSLTAWSDSALPSSGSTLAVTQDADGYLWLGTDAGLFRFDGFQFSRLEGGTIPEARVSGLCAGADGSLWVGFSLIGGVIRIQRGEITSYTAADGLPSGHVDRLLAGRDGTIWAGGYRGLSKFRDGRWERVHLPSELADAPITALHEDAKGALWIGNQNGIYRRPAGAAAFEPFMQTSYRVIGFSEDSAGTVWATHPSQGAIKLDELSSEGMSPEGGPIGVRGSDLLHDRSGNLWIATRAQGLIRMFRDDVTGKGRVERINITDGLTSDSVRSLFEDRQGDIWVGTQAGLTRLSPRRVITVVETEGVGAVTASSDGSVWVATPTGVLRISKGATSQYETVDGPESNFPGAIHAGEDGTVWVVTSRGIVRFASGRVQRLPFPSGVRLELVQAVVADREGTLWICDWLRGLLQFRDGLLAAVPTPPGLGAPYSAHADRSGRVWVGFSSGSLAVYEAGTVYPRLARYAVTGDTIHAFYEDDQGALWVGSNSGLGRIENGELVQYSRYGLPTVPVWGITQDTSANLWLGVGSGLVRIAATELTRIQRPPSDVIAHTTYDSTDGLQSMPIRVLQPSATRSGDGRLWFVTARGLAVVDPERAYSDHVVPPLRIESVLADSQRLDPTRLVNLPALTSSVSISYTALEFRAPGKVRFRYKLEPLDPQWTDAGTRRSASYTRLPPGSYRLRVAVRHVGEPRDDALAELDFSVEPMFYQTVWFAVVTMMGLGAGLAWLWRLRVRAVQRRFALVLAERVRVAREIHDTLLQGLVGIAVQSKNVVALLDVSPERARPLLERLGRYAEYYIRETRHSIWDLRSPGLDRQDVSEQIRHIGNRLLENTASQFNFTCVGEPRDVPVRLKEHLSRVSQEAISNAVRHGAPSKIDVQLRYEAASIVLTVWDDGRGFDEAVERHAGWGLANMRERAAELGGHLTITARPGGGTTIEMDVPLTAV